MTATIKREKVTPSKARKWLQESNSGNRKMRKGIVSSYARDIMAGQWLFTGDSIRFNGNGGLIDGQHRLAAVIEANHPIDAIVIRGLESESKYCIDTGSRRTLSDVLHYQGFTHTISLAATIRWCIRYERELLDGVGYSGSVIITVPEALAWLDKNPGIVDCVQHVGNQSLRYASMRCALIAIRYYTAKENPGDADTFIARIIAGEDLHEGDPVLTLRRWLEWTYMREGRMRSTRVTQGITVKAWNAYIEGRKVKSLTYRPGGVRAESFPVIIGCDHA